jgi:hypothetical protein
MVVTMFMLWKQTKVSDMLMLPHSLLWRVVSSR